MTDEDQLLMIFWLSRRGGLWLVRLSAYCTDESEIQEVNPPKTVAPPLQLQLLNKKGHIK